MAVLLRLVTTSAAAADEPPADARLDAVATAAEPALVGRGFATAGLLMVLIGMAVAIVVLAARRTRHRPRGSAFLPESPLPMAPESPLPAAPSVPETPLPAPRIATSLAAPVQLAPPLAPPVPLPVRSSRRPDRAAVWPRGADTPGIGPGSGDTLGQYQLLACVGQGGMGRVWAARRIGSPIQRLVALKTGLEAGNRSAEFRESFTDEARIASLIRHPNVCGVYEFGQEGDVLYQAMEWCDGASLRQVLDWLPEPRLDLPVAARIIASVSAGLHAAHQLEDDDGVALHVVHRDVSPQNILISRQGQVQVTDFGVAKTTGTFQRNGNDVRGKASYMAPEQVTGDEVDQRTDIFALGCVLYEATVGRVPFQSEGGLSSTYQLLAHEVHPPQAFIPDFPAELASVVMKALARDPRDRFQSAEELGVALEAWLARAHGIVTEQTIAELMTSAAEPFIKEKARRVDQALARLAPPVPLAAMALLSSGAASVKTAVRSAPRTSEPPRVPRPRPREHVITGSRSPAEAAETAARPTIPAGRRRS